MNLPEVQKAILENKKIHGFNTTDLNEEFLHLYGEVSEAWQAFLLKKDDFGEELADIAIYLFGIAEISGIDLGKEIESKMVKNKLRSYSKVGNGYERSTKTKEVINNRRHEDPLLDLPITPCTYVDDIDEAIKAAMEE